ncbi:hypothetical protein [Streptomyces sp. NPDC056361]|uniref:hypothetical protein n=1 Tax=Streptomyces sp. NPDC056361 TaxID=3345795 RepID=UPI0035D89041
MRSYTGVLIGHLLFAALCLFPGPLALVIAYIAWSEGDDWAWIPLAVGLAVSAAVPVTAHRAARQEFPRITRRDRLKDTSSGYADDSFVLWAPRSEAGPPQAELVRADVVEASLVRYEPDNEATFTTYGGDYAPAEFTPLVRLRLRVRRDEGAAATGPFEVTDEWRVPPLCLSAVTAGRLAVFVDPATPAKVTPLWPRSALLAGTRTCRVVDLEGRVTDLTRRSGRQLEQMRLSRAAGGVPLIGDTIHLGRLDPETAARYTALADRYRAFPEEQAPASEPGEEDRWITDALPGGEGSFGSVRRRWARRGGHLVRARFLRMSGTTTFQVHGPVLDTVLRIRPADGSPPFDASRRLTVPMNYLAVLNHTQDVVLVATPDSTSFVVDWPRTNLLAGVTTARVVTPDGHTLPLPPRSPALWPLMTLLASHAVSHPTPVLDLRTRRLQPLAGPVMDVLRSC